MSLRTSLRFREPRSVIWNPEQIPRSLSYSVFDFERTPQISTSGSAITAFADPIKSASFSQGTGSAQPTLDATGFNGRPCATFDGGDSLRNTTALATLGWPTSGAFEVLALVDAAAVIGNGTYFAYPVAGNGGLSLAARLDGDGTTFRIRAAVGTGSATVNVDNSTLQPGKHLIRFVSDGTNCRLDVDGVVGTPVAAAASFSGGPRNTIGGSAAASAGSLFTGNVNFIGFYKALPSAYADKLTAYLLTRKG